MASPAAPAQAPVLSQTLAEVQVRMRVRIRGVGFRSPFASPSVPVLGADMGPGQSRVHARGSDCAMEEAAGTRTVMVDLV